MRELEKRQKLRRWLYSLPALALLLVLTLALAKGAYSLMLKERESAHDAAALREKVGILQQREHELALEINKLQTEAGIEEEIKARFNVARAGEHVAVLVDRPDSSASTTPQKQSWLKRFWDAIIRINNR
jgi:cell division protein FtsB